MNYINPYATLIVHASHTNAEDRFNKPKCDIVYFHFIFYLTRIMHMYMYYYSFNAMYSVHPAFRTKKKKLYKKFS